MPELPEVETTRRGLAQHMQGRRIATAIIRNSSLRWPIPRDFRRRVAGRMVRTVQRRGKYLLFDCETGWIMLHLGMSGSLQVVPGAATAGKHDHLDLVLDSGMVVRFNDPRRFGAVLWEPGDPLRHRLLTELAPEPLGTDFTAAWLHNHTRTRNAAIKSVVMDSHIVVGVGNIYASESLFRAGIHPAMAARRLSLLRCEKLVAAIQQTLQAAIEAGGSTLRNYVGAEGRPGYFQKSYFVYGRAGQPCQVCVTPIKAMRQGQRSTFYCPVCQRR